MKRKIVLYCPDRHILYDGRTPDERGVGGGITSRVRLAAALAENGHDVSVVCNCPARTTIDRVSYLPLDSVEHIRADVLIANTSGGAYDLSPISHMTLDVDMKVLWVSGVAHPLGIDVLDPDVISAKSNFLRKTIKDAWPVENRQVVVLYNGFVQDYFMDPIEPSTKDPYRLVYASHPAKGLDRAIEVLDRLRSEDERFHLVIVGTEELWGQPRKRKEGHAGVIHRGLLPQPKVAAELQRASYSVCLQEIEEGFGLSLLESMRAGCIVIASQVGAFRELVEDGFNGVQISGHYLNDHALKKSVKTIRALSVNDARRHSIQKSASEVPWSWTVIADAWSQFIRKRLRFGWVGNEGPMEDGDCLECGGCYVNLFDGWHCWSCGAYVPTRNLPLAINRK